MPLRVHQALADELVRAGVGALFTVPSSGTMKIALFAEERGARAFTTRHEHATIGMADGYARVSGGVGVALVGKGPGLTNGVNALITARNARTSVLLIAGNQTTAVMNDPELARRDITGMQNLDQQAFLAALGVPSVMLDSPASARSDLRAAYEYTAAGGGPVAVLLPADVAEAEAGAEPARAEFPHVPPSPAQGPSVDDIALLAELLGETWAVRRPVIIAGRGAVVSDATPHLVQLGELTGSLLATSLAAKNAFHGSPFTIGVVGTEATPTAIDLLMASDLVLAFGASLNQFTTYAGDLFASARLVHIDADAEAIGLHRSVDLPIVADARLAAAALVEELERRGHRSTGYRTPNVQQQIAGEDQSQWLRDEGRQSALDPRIVLDRIDRLLPRDRAIVVDIGAHMSFTSRFLTTDDPRALLLCHDFGSVGAGMGIALGAAVARPDRLTVLAIGDGGLMMTLADLDTAVRYRLPVVLVVMNDSGFAQEMQLLDLDGLPSGIAVYENPSFARVAQALGARGVRIDSLDDLDGLPDVLGDRSGPTVIDCAVTSEIRGEHIDLMLRMRRAVAQPAG
jgi:acetolactate synthase I/II/III large subunit